jgi:predicted PurR-regulated permease PerM
MTKTVAKFSFAILTTLLALVILWQFRVVIVYVLLSLTIAAALRPLIRRLDGKSLVKRLSWIFLYLIVLVGFVYLIFLAGKIAVIEIQALTQTLSVRNAWVLPEWLQGSAVLQSLITQLPTPSALVKAIAGDGAQLILPEILGLSQGIVGIVTGTSVILLFTIYWIINQVHFERLWLSQLSSDKRKRARGVWRTIEPDLGGYIRSQFYHSLLAGLILGLGYWALGSPYPMLLAFTGAIACLIPVVGAVLAVIITLLIGLLTGIQLTVLTVLFTFAILLVLTLWVKPYFFNRKWDNPILTLILLIALAYIFGLLGIIIAPPLSAICQILWERLVKHRLVAGNSARIADLKEREKRVWGTIHSMNEPPPELVLSSIKRLDDLLEKAEPYLHPIDEAESSE